MVKSNKLRSLDFAGGISSNEASNDQNRIRLFL